MKILTFFFAYLRFSKLNPDLEPIEVDKTLFKFKYLPEFADYILQNKLDEFVLVGIRYCRELELPLLKPLSHLSEKELVNLSLESNRIILNALKENTIADFIQTNLNAWIANKLEIIDQFEVVPEDLTLVYYIRRKLFAYFLYGYTQSAALQLLIISEVDQYTSTEELISLKVYFKLQEEKFNKKDIVTLKNSAESNI